MLKRLIPLIMVISTVAALAVFCIFYWLVVFSPGDDIRQENIEKILAVESPVMYSGGKDKIGVFFETSHRQYVPYDQIPRDFINGIVSAEDNSFFEHYGFDLYGVLRALIANVKAGRVVQGGSTITQQTAKNLFKRKDRSILSKLKELLFALRLEYHYPKEKILEFYANQFYVSGNGRGFGVAARYYFNKDAADLDLLECAFVAGSVKRPNYYNPFVQRGAEAEALARERSKQRVRYVLGQMLDNGYLDPAIYAETVGREIPFEQGKMYFSLNTIMDLVKDALGEPEIIEALQDHGIDNVATSGVKIITSVDKNIQEESFAALRKELSRLDVRLRGYDRAVVQDEYLELTRRKNQDRRPGSFHFARIVAIEAEPEPRVTVSFGDSPAGLPEGFIDEKGLMNLVSPLVKYEKNRWTEPQKGDLAKFMPRLEVGDLVYTSIRAVNGKSGEVRLDLEKYPLLQGGVLAMRDGMIKAMVGGMENRYFNRAVSAKRSVGSVVKPLVYNAALQLGWNSIDVLNNQRDVFVYQKMAYFPRPDHLSPFKGVSMSWAGVHSENLATIWLLYHLCDRLTPAQFNNVVGGLGLGQLPGESAADYRRRIRDDLGILVDNGVYYEVAFERAITELEPDLIFAGRIEEYETVAKLHYGRYFEKFFSEVDNELGLLEEGVAKEKIKQNLSPREKAAVEREVERNTKEARLRKTILKSNFLRLEKLRNNLDRLRDDLNKDTVATEGEGRTQETFLFRDRNTGKYIYFEKDEMFGVPEQIGELELPGEQEKPLDGNLQTAMAAGESNPVPDDWEVVDRDELLSKLASFADDQVLLPEDYFGEGREQEFWDSVLIDNSLSAGTLRLIGDALNREYERLKGLEPYGAEFLHEVRDFRVMVALHFMVGLCRAIGIESDLEPVLSFPLGSNVMSLIEVARAYESMLTGVTKRYAGPNGGGGEGLAIIERIEGSDGEVIYEPSPVETRVVSEEVRIATSDILRRVVKFGTGRYADQNVRLRSLDPAKDRLLVDLDARVPLVGKTGTSNDFTNASFVGGVPSVGSKGLFSMQDGYVLTSYVGFDDNSPMIRNTTHITGAGGPLPIWARIANRILLENNDAARVDLVDISFSDRADFALYYPDVGQVEIPVDPGRGGVPTIDGNTGASLITFGEVDSEGRIKPFRFFAPYWQVEGNGDD